jgi:taurine dioxygenase
MQVTKLSDAGAAEITGLDCSQPLDRHTKKKLWAAFLENPILCIRDQRLTPAQQASFARQYGPLEAQDRSPYTHPDDPDILILSNEIRPDGTAVGIVDAGDFWHSDSSHHLEPCQTTILYSVRNPSRGGDTEFCNMYLAYEALSDDLKQAVEGREAIHHVSKTRNPRVTISPDRPGAKDYYEARAKEVSAMRQPIVRTHPETDRQALYISPRFTIGIADMPDAEAQPLLDRLFATFVKNRAIQYRHKWKDGDLVMWDNRCLNHRAVGGYGLPDVRRMHRTTIAGDKAFYHPNLVPFEHWAKRTAEW